MNRLLRQPAPVVPLRQACRAPATAHRPTAHTPHQHAAAASAALLAMIALGSGGFAHLDPALVGYLGGTLVAAYATAWRISATWRRPAAAFYAAALADALRTPGGVRRLAGDALHVLVAQRFIRRRSPARWAAHLLLSLGTLAAFAITLPLVFGWMHFAPSGEYHYRLVLFTFATARFPADGAIAWLAFHALTASGVAVTLGAAYFLAVRWRRRREAGSTAAGAVAPLLLLLAVSLSGLALPASRALPGLFAAAAWLHQITVIALLVALPFSKLSHLFTRPLQLGAHAVAAAPPQACATCGDPLAAPAQVRAVSELLAARGASAAVTAHCQKCRRRQVAIAQSATVAAGFRAGAAHAAPAPAAGHRGAA